MNRSIDEGMGELKNEALLQGGDELEPACRCALAR